jgi:hypothetical protein
MKESRQSPVSENAMSGCRPPHELDGRLPLQQSRPRGLRVYPRARAVRDQAIHSIGEFEPEAAPLIVHLHQIGLLRLCNCNITPDLTS